MLDSGGKVDLLASIREIGLDKFNYRSLLCCPALDSRFAGSTIVGHSKDEFQLKDQAQLSN